MQTTKKIGADTGNDTLKIVHENGEKFEVMNMVSPGYNRRILGGEKGHLSNLLDVSIRADNKDLGRYFVGGLAFKESRGDFLERTAEDIKAQSTDTIILLMTGLAYSVYDSNNPIKTENIELGTLLPVNEYFEDELLEKFKSKISNKTYTVKFHSGSFNGAEISINIIDDEITPEGAASVLAYSYNLDGTEKQGMENIENEVHLGVDIGSITTDLSIMEYGEFNSRGFIGIPVGMSEPLDKIAVDIRQEYGTEMTRHQLDYFIRSNKPIVINKEGKTIDITDKVKEFSKIRFDYFTRLLVNRINKELSLNGINTALLNKINMSGGGAILSLDGFKKEFKKGNVNLVEDARFANARGALISILMKTAESEVAADEILG